MHEKDLRIGYLLDFYGAILNDRKRSMMNAYYNEDMSLAEIAEENGISRQGVRDTLQKCADELSFYEERLGLMARFDALERAMTELRQTVDALALSDDDKEKMRQILNTVDTVI